MGSRWKLQQGWISCSLTGLRRPFRVVRGLSVVPSSRRPASRFRAYWRPLRAGRQKPDVCVGDEEIISLSHAKVYVFSDSVLCLGKMNQNPQSNTVLEDKLTWFKSSPQYRTLDTIDGEPMELEWNIFPGFTTLLLCNKVQDFISKMSVEPEEFTGRIIFMSMFNDISWGSQDNEQECELNANLVSIYARRSSQEDGHSSDLDQKRSGILLMIANHKENGT